VLVVSDASPLIALSDASLLELLHEAFGEILIPKEVADEVFAPKHNRAKPWWIKIADVEHPKAVELFVKLRSVLDKGESAAIALASTMDATVLIDEELGTAECQRLGACRILALCL